MRLHGVAIAVMLLAGCVSATRYQEIQVRNVALEEQLRSSQSQVLGLEKQTEVLSKAADGRLIKEFEELQRKHSELAKTMQSQAMILREKDGALAQAKQAEAAHAELVNKHKKVEAALRGYLSDNSLKEIAASYLKNEDWQIAEVLGSVTVKDDVGVDTTYVVFKIGGRRKVVEQYDWRRKTDAAKQFWAKDEFHSITVLDTMGTEASMREPIFLNFDLENRIRNSF